MTAQVQAKRQNSRSRHTQDDSSNALSSSEQKKLLAIAIQMKKTKLSPSFIVSTVLAACEYEGVADLMKLWEKEEEQADRDEIIADIQEMLEEFNQNEKSEEKYVKFNDLDKISEDIRGFKDSLYQEVMKRGGITKLSELTGIPQPSLSRFFNSNSMPRRATVLTIAKALELDKLPIDLQWSK